MKLNQNGYAVKEMIILCAVIAVFYAVAITKVSYAYQDAAKTDEIAEMQKNSLQKAAETYVTLNKDKFKEETTYFYGKDLVESNLIIETENTSFSTAKFKVTHPSGTDNYTVSLEE